MLTGYVGAVTSNLRIKVELFTLLIATFFLRVGFSASLILFDWMLVWGLEHGVGAHNAFSFQAIMLSATAGITFLIAEILLTGYYGNRSDVVGAKPVVLFSTLGAAIVILLYTPAPYFIFYFEHDKYIGLILMVIYLALVHFLHGVVAAANVAPSIGFINRLSTYENRALHMAWYDNAILYGRAIGMALGGILWVKMGVDNETLTVKEEARRISMTFPYLTMLLVIATILLFIGLENPHRIAEPKPFSIKEDIGLAVKVMLQPERRYLLLPWISISALIGSASLWGPSVTFRVSNEQGSERGLHALIPIIIVVTALALPAPFWGWFADRKGRATTLRIGILGIPVLFLGALIGYPFYKNDFSLTDPYLLGSVIPGLMLISALVPVLMGKLGDTAHPDKQDDGKVMSGYHFVIAFGEIVGILLGGVFIGFFSILGKIGVIKDQSIALVLGFVLFESILIILMIIGIYQLPEDEPIKQPIKVKTPHHTQ